ncbi:meiotic recombination-associated protein [Fusarium heterosporum]|uniref:DNA topoisomerase (ATP-hydrolyzing) n=1 Tax=Fusarium heterosporum TaxID=42747 RepID=A0A8H5TSB1_FUSHE|nr:meiotic recombination-associated protein [Fusarium heterosporum]
MDGDGNLAQENATQLLTQGDAHSASEASADENTDTNTTDNSSVGSVVARIESIFMQVVDALHAGQELALVHTSRRSSRRSTAAQPEVVHYPGRNLQEAIKFARLILILQLSHDALVSGTVLTKRHIFYQHQDLFDKQTQVDELVDDIAFNMGVSRGDLNLVAASKGVLAGPLTIRLNDGSTLDPCSGEMGVAVPTSQSISGLNTRDVNWILVVEKDLPILGLFDYDPDGIKILRCYRYGSDRLGHETDLSTHALQWLGIKSTHLFRDYTGSSFFGSCHLSRFSQVSITSTSCRDPVSYLSARERKAASSALKKIEHPSTNEIEVCEVRHELQLMLMLGFKAEIEWLDESGDLCSWLDGEIGEALISDAT